MPTRESRVFLWLARPSFPRKTAQSDIADSDDRRDEKRYQEKKNKAERDRKKKEDNTRRRTMIDTALALDPRIKAFRAAEKAAREAKRKGGVANGGAAVDPKVKAEEERKAKEEAEKAAADQAAKDASDKVRFLHSTRVFVFAGIADC